MQGGIPNTITRYPDVQSARETATVVGSSCPSLNITAHGFTARSVRIDNQTNQYLILGPDINIIRPYTVGIVINIRGQGTVSLSPQRPTFIFGSINAVNGESYSMTLYDKPQIESSGQSVFSTAPVPIHQTETQQDQPSLSPSFLAKNVAGWYVLQGVIQYVCSATVGDRLLMLFIKDNVTGHITFQFIDSVLRAASEGVTYIMRPGSTDNVTEAGQVVIGVPVNLFIPQSASMGIFDLHQISGADALTFDLLVSPLAP